MTKQFYILHLCIAVLYCKYLVEAFGDDKAIYLFSLVASLGFSIWKKLRLREAVISLACVLGITLWMCHLLLDARYQLVTEYLSHVRPLTVGLVLVAEIVVIRHVAQRYKQARLEEEKFACESFLYAIEPYPMLPELRRTLLVEFNIWRSLFIRSKLIAERDGVALQAATQINPGFQLRYMLRLVFGLCLVDLASIVFVGGFWALGMIAVTIYIALVLNCETRIFGSHSIYESVSTVKIPNGVFGFVTLRKDSVQKILCAHQKREHEHLSICRLAPGNVVLQLAEPIEIFGSSIKTLSLCVVNVDAFLACFNLPEQAS